MSGNKRIKNCALNSIRSRLKGLLLCPLRNLFALLCFVLLLAVSPFAMAVSDTAPPGAGQILQQIERDLEVKPAPAQPALPVQMSPLADEQAEKVTIKQFKFSGNRVLSEADLQEAVAPLTNRSSAYTGNYTSTFLGSDASLAVISGLATGTNVGSHASNIAVSGAVLDNYNVPIISDASLLISPRPISFTPTLATKVIGDADPALEVTISAGSLAPTDALSDVTGAISRTAGEEVAIYDILIGAGIKAANYEIAYNASNAAFSITDRAVESTGSIVAGAILVTEDEKDDRRDGKGRRDRRRSSSGRCFP